MQTIYPGEQIIRLTEPVDWREGERIVIASSSYDMYEYDECTIAAVSDDKVTLTCTYNTKITIKLKVRLSVILIKNGS